MIILLVARVRPILRFVPLLVVLATAPLLFNLAKGWLYAHPLRLRSTNDHRLVQLGIPYEEIVLRSADGVLLLAWYTPPVDDALILVGHGYANVRPVEIHALFARHGFGVLSWDFRAHGESQGSLCTVGYDEALDVEAALDYALAQPDVSWVGMWGGSMGGAAALHAASRRPEIRAVVGDSVPSNARGTLEIVARAPMLRSLVQGVSEREMGLGVDDIRPDRWISQMSQRPVLLIQGGEDSKIPLDSAQHLYRAAGGYPELWFEPNVGHLKMLEDLPKEYEQRVIAFFREARSIT
jgi:pimeloyl-ACP methyl ester carboxylesterase